MSQYLSDSIFWIEVDKIDPNPFQPRREFDEARLKELADSLRQYGFLQPLTVTRKEVMMEDGGLQTRYELIAGERRLRASKLAGLTTVPATIRAGEDDNRVKLELAIIENLQREDLNAVDRARAFERLVNEFGFKHAQIAEKVGKSREYVSNTLRLLLLPPEMIEAVSTGKISEGHTRPLLMLADRPDEQLVLFKEIVYKRLSVRETEGLARRVAYDRVRKKEYLLDPDIADLETQLTESLGTRVKIEQKEKGGKVVIDFFGAEDLRALTEALKSKESKGADHLLNKFIEKEKQNPNTRPTMQEAIAEREAELTGGKVGGEAGLPEVAADTTPYIAPNNLPEMSTETVPEVAPQMSPAVIAEQELATTSEPEAPVDDRSREEQEEDLYSVKNFVI
jgi:ParB family chromosome partitioning protein